MPPPLKLKNLFDGDHKLFAMAVDNNGHVGLSTPLRLNVQPPATKESGRLPASRSQAL
jgi:hypothetical protein